MLIPDLDSEKNSSSGHLVRRHDDTGVGKAQDVARQYGLDLSDALQTITVKERFKHWAAHESKTVLATADRVLAEAGRKEGLRIWNCEDTPKPAGD